MTRPSEMTTGDLKTMPRGRPKNKRTTRRRFTGIRVLPALEAFAQTAVWTDAAFGLDPISFLVSNEKVGSSSSSSSRITLKELTTRFNKTHYGTTKTESQLVMQNIENNWQKAAIKSVTVGIGFRIINRLTRKARSSLNTQLLKPLGVADMVRM